MRRLAALPAICLFSCCLFACGVPGEDPDAAGGMDGTAGMGGMAMAHGDHSPRYGGHVFMHGDLHFEVVLGDSGEHRIYFSDAMRSELPAAVAEDVRITLRRGGEGGELEPLRPEIDEFGEAWVARSRPIESEDTAAIVYFRFEGSPYEIEVPYLMAPPTVDPHTGRLLPAAPPPDPRGGSAP